MRVFKVVKIHIPLESHPPQLRGVLGYEFFEYDAERGRAREAGAASPTLEARDRKTVYLAETVFDLRQERELIKRELQQHGHVVLPEVELPLSGAALGETVRDCLSRSDLSVHLVGGNYGIIPEEENRSLVEIQCGLAGEAGESLRRIVWMPVGVEPRDERQRQFIKHLQHDLGGQRRVELLQTSLEDLKKLIEERVGERAVPTPDPTPGSPPPPKSRALRADDSRRLHHEPLHVSGNRKTGRPAPALLSGEEAP